MDKLHQRIGSVSNAHVGREFESLAKAFFQSQGLHLRPNVKIPVGIGENKKLHAFDLGCMEQKILVECKSHKWTAPNDNVPSAKLTVWNEAMYYFFATPNVYRKILFVLKDFSVKRQETLAAYYLRTYKHLIPEAVEIWEFDAESAIAVKIN